MTHHPREGVVRSHFSQELTRRRLLAAFGIATAAGMAPGTSHAAQTATPPPVDQARVDLLIALSRTLCGGGDFAPPMATQLLNLMSGDAALSRGLDALLATPALAMTPPPATPAADSAASEAAAAAEAILIYWYVGYFGGNPIPDRSQAYDSLVAWQAMYTAPFAVCKEFGGWADPPQTRPVVLGM